MARRRLTPWRSPAGKSGFRIRSRRDERREDNRAEAQAGAGRDQPPHARPRPDGLRRLDRHRHACELRGAAPGSLRARKAAGESPRTLSDAGPDRRRPQGRDRHRRDAAAGTHHHVRLREPRLEAVGLQRVGSAGPRGLPDDGRTGERRDADLSQGRSRRPTQRTHAKGWLLLRCDHPPEADRPRPSRPRRQHRAICAADRGGARRHRGGCARHQPPANTPCSPRS